MQREVRMSDMHQLLSSLNDSLTSESQKACGFGILWLHRGKELFQFFCDFQDC